MGQIFYGAGQNAKDNIEMWILGGYYPDCFVDKDVKKQHTFFKSDALPDGVEILSLQEALYKYPQNDIYITLCHSNLKTVTEELIRENIDRKKIKYFEDVEYRFGCNYLLKTYLMENKIKTCCSAEYMSMGIPFSGNTETDYHNYLNFYQEILNDWKEDRAGLCEGCENLKKEIWEITPQVQEINISSKDNADICNAKCMYCCGYPKKEDILHEERKNEVVQTLKFFEKKFPNKIFDVAVSGGDISVAPFREELFEIIMRNNWNAKIMTNAAILCEGICEALKNSNTSILVTLDTTDAGLYTKIKGINALDKVLNNLRIYASCGTVWIKWIALEAVYSSFEDIRGVADFAEEIGAGIVVSCNVFNIEHQMSDLLKKMTFEFIYYVKDKDLPLYIMYDHFNRVDAEQLKSYFEL